MVERYLGASGLHASIDRDDRVPGSYVLSIGGAEQSHVNVKHPDEVFYEYLRRIANVVDLAGPRGAPLRCLHLGAGALTLARYVQATRPGSEQVAVELERELLDFVLEHLPMPDGSDLTVHFGDARQVLAFGDIEGLFDVIVLDVFAGEDAPEHLTTADFYKEILEILGPDGVLLVNVGDDPPLTFAKRQAKELMSVASSVTALAETGMFSGRRAGNIVLTTRRGSWPDEWTDALLAAGPHPAAVLTGADLESFAAD